MYLNLDLLYNIDNYLYPLFYYQSCNYKSNYRVYSPMIKKFLYIYSCYSVYYDFITKKMQTRYFILHFDDKPYIITENTITWRNIIHKRCNPFKLNSKDLYFLKNNIRIN